MLELAGDGTTLSELERPVTGSVSVVLGAVRLDRCLLPDLVIFIQCFLQNPETLTLQPSAFQLRCVFLCVLFVQVIGLFICTLLFLFFCSETNWQAGVEVTLTIPDSGSTARSPAALTTAVYCTQQSTSSSTGASMGDSYSYEFWGSSVTVRNTVWPLFSQLLFDDATPQSSRTAVEPRYDTRVLLLCVALHQTTICCADLHGLALVAKT
jgi:hypothetical protein